MRRALPLYTGMDARLWTLIGTYQAKVAESVAMLEGGGIARPRSAQDWVKADFPQRGALPNGFTYQKREAGCIVQGPAWSVDFDFDGDGRIDGFDASRLFEFARRRFSCFGFKSEHEFRSAVEDAVSAGELSSAGGLHYLTAVAMPPSAAPRRAPPPKPEPLADDPNPMPDRRRRFIAWWQIVFGTVGLLAFVLFSLDLPRGTQRSMVEVTGPYNIILGLVFFGASVRFGVDLLRGQRRGIIGSAVCQGLQVVSFAIVGGAHVSIHAGPSVGLRLASDGFNVHAGFSSVFFLGTRIAGPDWEIAINGLALAWTLMLIRFARMPRPIVTGESTSA